ncbi:MAG: SDR family oxidoreductase [Planctomycetota bacterium]
MHETNKRLAGRVALVTGAGRGIGQAIAWRLAAEGASVAVCDLAAEDASHTAARARELGVDAISEGFDVQDATKISEFVKQTGQELGGVDVLVNNAAIMPVQTVESMSVELLDRVWQVNVRAAVLFSQAAAPWMRRSGGGVILHMSSAQGYLGSGGMGVYAATKAGLRILAQAQAKELAPDGIRVNTVSPGAVDSPMFEHEAAKDPEGPEVYRRNANALHPRGRIATMDEVAAAFAFLASDDAANITATDLRCDGGLVVAI